MRNRAADDNGDGCPVRRAQRGRKNEVEMTNINKGVARMNCDHVLLPSPRFVRFRKIIFGRVARTVSSCIASDRANGEFLLMSLSNKYQRC